MFIQSYIDFKSAIEKDYLSPIPGKKGNIRIRGIEMI